LTKEQYKVSHSRYIKVEMTAMGEERKAPTTMEKNGYDFIKLSMIHD
jgi:hypothetical protein